MGWAGGIRDVGLGHLSLQLAWIPFLTTLTNPKSELQETSFCSCCETDAFLRDLRKKKYLAHSKPT